MNSPYNDPNLRIMMSVADDLGDLREEVVFVGGCATGLLVTAVRAQTIRPTEDVDVVVQVASLQQYHKMERKLEARGFQRDTRDRAPICRWIRRGVPVDLMPTEAGILGFHNRWYGLAVETSERLSLPNGTEIRLVSAPAFMGTKLEAFKGRGRGDFLGSHDLEDVVTVVDGRASLFEEIEASPATLREYLGIEIGELLRHSRFVEALPGHLPPDRASQLRLTSLLEKLRRMGSLGTGAN